MRRVSVDYECLVHDGRKKENMEQTEAKQSFAEEIQHVWSMFFQKCILRAGGRKGIKDNC